MCANVYDADDEVTGNYTWGFIGDCGGDSLLEQHGQYRYIADTRQFVAFMHIGVAFLRHTFGEPPAGCVLGILWYHGPHGPGKAPIIAMGFDAKMAGISPEMTEYSDRLEKGLAVFDKVVDWKSIPRVTLS